MQDNEGDAQCEDAKVVEQRTCYYCEKHDRSPGAMLRESRTVPTYLYVAVQRVRCEGRAAEGRQGRV